jgi:hypothetical protein
MSGRNEIVERIGRVAPRRVRTTVRGVARGVGRVTRGGRVLPDFLVIGAQRAGTTALYHGLVQHPQVLGAVADKEVHFFDLHYGDGIDAYRGAFPTRASVRRAEAEVKVGEATPYYLFHPAVPARVGAALPHARLIAVLRDPVERAWSQYRHEVDLGYEDLSFEEALAREDERLAGAAAQLERDASATSFAHQHHSYVARGRYVEQLERWWSVFPRERLLLVRAEDLFAHHEEVFAAICAHLDVPRWAPASWRPQNASTAAELSAVTRSSLRRTFEPWNDRLADATGRDWAWPRDDAT